MKLIFTRKALRDLDRLKGFIAEKNAKAANRMIKSLLKSIRHLRDHARLGHEFENSDQCRELVSGNYIVVYLIDHEGINILRIWHHKENR